MDFDTSQLQHQRSRSASVLEAIESNAFQQRSKLNVSDEYCVLITLRVSDRQAFVRLLLRSEQRFMCFTCKGEVVANVEKVFKALPKDEHPCYVVYYKCGSVMLKDVLQPLFSLNYPPLCEQDYAEAQCQSYRYGRQLERRKVGEQRIAKVITASENIGTVFTLRQVDAGEVCKFYLCRFDRDASLALPKDVEPVSSESPIGEALLRWLQGQEIIEVRRTATEAGTKYRVVNRERISFPNAKRAPSDRTRTFIEEDAHDLDVDNAKFANGHFAREEKGWGSIPMADNYGDESSGSERDYEDYPEYVANYAD